MNKRNIVLVVLISIVMQHHAQQEDVKKHFENKSFTIGSGIFFNRNTVVDYGDKFKSNFFSNYTLRVGFSSEFKKNFYWESIVLFTKYENGYMFNYPNVFLGASSAYFKALESNLGVRYAVTSKKDRNIINIHTGINVGYGFGELGHVGNMGFTLSPNEDTPEKIHQFHAKVMRTSNFILGGYLGVSKDFRLSKKFTLGLLIQSQIGVNRVIEFHGEYVSLENPEKQDVLIYSNGTNIQTVVCLKYKLP
jgi:hypothetical protein